MPVDSQSGVDYGCDACGKPKAEHQGDDLVCPLPQTRFGAPRWRNHQYRWVDDGHKLTAIVNGFNVRPKLVHPEGCTAAFCGCMGEEFVERDADPDCDRCHGTGKDPAAPCWLQHAVDELGHELWEMSDWFPDVHLDEPVQIVYQAGWDEFRWRPR